MEKYKFREAEIKDCENIVYLLVFAMNQRFRY